MANFDNIKCPSCGGIMNCTVKDVVGEIMARCFCSSCGSEDIKKDDIFFDAEIKDGKVILKSSGSNNSGE